jgi:signal transduction histidine kinase
MNAVADDNPCKRVLLIEDDEDGALVVQGLLGRNPRRFQFEWVESLTAGMARLAAESFDLVILDLDLPDSEGLDTFHRLNQRHADIAVVILTGNEDEDAALSAVQAGAQDYLLKHAVNQRMLTRAAEYALERKRGERMLHRMNEHLEKLVSQRTIELQMLTRQLVEAQEAERRRIARELHDEAGQILTGLKLTLESVSVRSPEPIKPQLSQAWQIVQELSSRLRELSHSLRPAMLDDLGLLPALLTLCTRFNSQTGIRVDFRHTDLEGRRFTQEIETAAYRIVQEALTNVARHARVSAATVYVIVLEDTLSVQIADQGRGFDPAVSPAQPTHGLRGMRERAGLVEGKLRIDASPGAGVSITANIPLPSGLRRRETVSASQPSDTGSGVLPGPMTPPVQLLNAAAVTGAQGGI